MSVMMSRQAGTHGMQRDRMVWYGRETKESVARYTDTPRHRHAYRYPHMHPIPPPPPRNELTKLLFQLLLPSVEPALPAAAARKEPVDGRRGETGRGRLRLLVLGYLGRELVRTLRDQ